MSVFLLIDASLRNQVQVESAKELINSYGKSKTAFFLMADFELNKIIVEPLNELSSDIYFDFNGQSNYTTEGAKEQIQLTLEVDPYSFDKYYHEFDKVMDNLLYGNTYLINLTCKNKVVPNCELIQIFEQAKAKYKLFYRDKFVVFSPETFVTIKNGLISSFPMKGTIDANIPDAKKILLNDHKELSEHYTIVDLIRNDLSIHAGKVDVTKFRFVDHIKSNHKDLLQISSEIQGRLPDDYLEKLGDILFSMLPAGSISGAPKAKTVEIIKSTEAHPRGYYTGVCGIFDGVNFDSCVMIRYLEKEKEGFYYRSGGGITFMSQVEKEYEEMIDKIYIPTN